jgi:hypothetical protein
MIATAWDDVPQSPGPQEISLSGKLHIERIELSNKIEKLKAFMTMNPDFKALNYRHVNLLEEQLSAMQRYENILVQRMTILNNPNQN